jgi:hypothetical protein
MDFVPPVEWTAIVSAERDPDPHADVTVGIRKVFEAAGGYAPWIERQAGYSRAAVWLSLGMDWGHGWTPSDDRPAGPHGAVWPR